MNRCVVPLGVIAIVLFVASLTVVPAAGQRSPAVNASAKAKGPWAAPRTPWGDPDIQGSSQQMMSWGCRSSGPNSLPAGTRHRGGVCAEAAQAQRQADADQEEFVAPRAGGGGAEGGGTGPPNHWLERGKPSRRTSVVVAPSDGRIPFLNDAARQRSTTAVNARTSGRRPFDGPEALDLYDRCITRGFPHVIFPTIYNNTSQIVQGPGYVRCATR